MSEPDPIPTLLAHARAGDRAALGTLLQMHERLVYQACWRILGHAEDAAECAQEALVKVITHLDGFDGRSAFSTWVTRIAMNEALTRTRRRQVRRTASLDVESADGGAWAGRIADAREPDPVSRVEQGEELLRLRAALARLPDDQRQLIQMRDLEERDCDDIARRLHIPAGTLKSRLFRARAALRALMTASDPAATHEP